MKHLPLADRALVAALGMFAFTSFGMEIYLLFGPDLATATDPIGAAWYLYASRWDPIFLDMPLYLKIMSALSALVFGPVYLVLVWGFLRKRPWVRTVGLVQGSVLAYSTGVYLLAEVIGEAGRAHLPMVFLINGPYFLVPLWLIARVLRTPLFPSTESRAT